MAIDITMPALSPTMEEGTLARWLVKEGDSVSSGDLLAEIETDKATMEVESIDEGTVGKLLVSEGTEGVKVGAVILQLLEDGESADDLGKPKQAEAQQPSDTEEGKHSPGTAGPAHPENPTAERDETPGLGKPIASDPDIPTNIKMVETTVRDALRDGMAEEMRRDPTVFVMGEEVAEYQGAYKVTRELLQEFGAQRVVDTPITEYGFAGIGVGADRKSVV